MKPVSPRAGVVLDPPRHHPPDEILLDYTNGVLPDPETLMIEIHLATCAACREVVRMGFAIGGSLLESLPPADLPADLFNRTLQQLTRKVPRPYTAMEPQPSVAAESGIDARWPAPLRRRIARAEGVKWRVLPAGFRALSVPCHDESARIWIMKAPGGRGPLRHNHDRGEWTAVLEGGFTDEAGIYAAGDFAIADPGEEHRVVAEPGEGCVCVLMLRAQPRYTSWVGKLLAPFIRV
jgi:putative transcriptional regulator